MSDDKKLSMGELTNKKRVVESQEDNANMTSYLRRLQSDLVINILSIGLFAAAGFFTSFEIWMTIEWEPGDAQ